ncbi:MAG TPA: hypothetical protein VFJ51_09445 [Nitrososphaeraceae archaeon]|nr:hypothetical protein [Nitrososphaeraceae archaeon]
MDTCSIYDSLRLQLRFVFCNDVPCGFTDAVTLPEVELGALPDAFVTFDTFKGVPCGTI